RHDRAARDHPHPDPPPRRQPRGRGGHPPHETAHGEDARRGLEDARGLPDRARGQPPRRPVAHRRPREDPGPAVLRQGLTGPPRAARRPGAGTTPAIESPLLMKRSEGFVKKLLLVLAGLAAATAALAQLSKNKDWDKSPEAYFLTSAERADWKNVKTDEEADKFIAVYYARRGGEAFKQEISRRIAAADQQFKLQRYKRGADSGRGHL